MVAASSEENNKWEFKIHKAREIRKDREIHKNSVGLLYERAVLLNECYEDAEFIRWHQENGTSELEYLDEEVDAPGLDFLTVRAVLKSFPKKEDWLRHQFRTLVAMVIDLEKKSREEEEGGPSRERVSWKKRAEAAEKECERLRAENATLKESLQ